MDPIQEAVDRIKSEQIKPVQVSEVRQCSVPYCPSPDISPGIAHFSVDGVVLCIWHTDQQSIDDSDESAPWAKW